MSQHVYRTACRFFRNSPVNFMTLNSTYTYIAKAVFAAVLCLSALSLVVMPIDRFSIISPVQAQSVTQNLTIENAHLDRYKIVYNKEVQWKEYTLNEKDNKKPSLPMSQPDFMKQLNLFTKLNYRLRYITQVRWNTIGIVEKSAEPYQYLWFETHSPFWFTKDGFEENYRVSARKGFRLVAHLVWQAVCVSDDEDAPLGRCLYDDIFVLERKLEDMRPQDFTILYQSPKWRDNTLESNINNELQALLQEGYVPKYIFSKNELFLERESSATLATPEQIELKYIIGNKWKNRVNELAQKGYRLLCVNDKTAVMIRKKSEITSITYTFLDTKNKSFRTQLVGQERSKGVYRMKADNYTLVFEQSLTNKQNSIEYKIQEFYFQEDKRPIEEKIYYILDKESQEREKELNSLVKDNYQILDVFITFDRKQKGQSQQTFSVLLGRFS